MHIPILFKYGGLISVPLFLVILLPILRKSPGFSFKNYTVSKLVLFIKDPIDLLIFRLNFLLKAVLDCGFYIYFLKVYNISFQSFLGIILLTSACFFGLLSYFIEGKYSRLHKALIYSSGTLLAVSQVLISLFFHNTGFTVFTFFVALLTVGIAFVF